MSKPLINVLYEISMTGKRPSNATELNMKELKEISRRHRLKPALFQVYQQISINGLDWKIYNEQERKKWMAFKEILRIFNRQQIDYLVIKGLAMRKFYPSQLPRQSNDFDVLLKDLRNFHKSVEFLFELGYKLETFPIFTNNNGKIYGMIVLEKIIDDTTNINIELSIGGFLLSEITFLDDPYLWSKKQILIHNSFELYIPNREMCMLLLIGETTGNKYSRIRDAIDYNFIKKEEFNWDVVHKKLRKYHLTRQFKKLKQMVQCLDKGRYKKPKHNNFNALLWRMEIELFHVTPSLLSSNYTFQKMFYHILKLFGTYFYQADFWLSFVKKIDHLIPANKCYQVGIPTYFIPLRVDIVGRWKLVEVEGILLARTPMGTFLGSNFCLHNDNELKQADRLALKIFGKN
ncbi:nucleotidyltransferase family protein [Bacillus gobiensis]|uniref:nucleotidyltransferase family protein n=1 Tax=Bacillus gobiensis TaxID=1441095 RepID=UPI003D236F6F